jgi:hypothetical protein
MLADRVASRRAPARPAALPGAVHLLVQSPSGVAGSPCTFSPNRLAPSPRHTPARTAALPAAALLLAQQHRRRPTRSYSPSCVADRRAPARPTTHRAPARPAASPAAVLLLDHRVTVLSKAKENSCINHRNDAYKGKEKTPCTDI